MEIILSDQQNISKKQQSKYYSNFDKLWQKVQKKQKVNDKLAQEMDELIQVYNKHVAPKEKEFGPVYSALLKKLIAFYSRKSLEEEQRAELERWLTDILEQLGAIDAELAQEHSESFDNVYCDYHQISLEEMHENEKKLEAEFDEMHSHAAEDNVSDDDVSEVEDSEQTESDLEPENLDDQDQDEPKPEPELADRKQVINDKWIRSLFRRTARALHPDKELDPVKREHKHALMSELLNAREKQDIMSMMMLYKEHVDDSELLLDATEMEHLCELLQQQYEQLDEAKLDIIYQSRLHETIYKNLHGGTKKTRDKKLKLHIEDVQDGIDFQIHMTKYLKNLNCLKSALEERAGILKELDEEMAW